MARYKVISELGRGGMGVVYRARHLDLDREVAMKVMRVQGDTGSVATQRFEREIASLIRLEHPGIVRIFDQGMTDEGPYFTMELIEGRSLHQVLESEGRFAPQRIVTILTQLIQALDFCHSHGVLHRDVKPRNVMLGDDDHVTLMDFGLVLDPDRTALTAHGARVGTPRYLAPETVAGSDYSPASDLHAAGLLAHEMATGIPLIPRDLPFEATMKRIRKELPPSLRDRVPDFPPDLDALVLELLAKKPSARPGAKEVLLRLESLARPDRRESRSPPVEARTALAPRTLRWARSRRAATVSALAFAGLTATCVIFLTRDPGPPATPPSPAPSIGPVAPSPAPPLDLDAERARFIEMGARIRETMRLRGALVEGLKFVSNEPEVLPLLHQVVEELDTLWRRTLGPGGPGMPEILGLIRLSESGLSPVRKFFGRQSRSAALRQRVSRLGRHLEGLAGRDPGKRLIEPVLRKLVEVSADPTPGRHADLARAYLVCHEGTATLADTWRASPRGLELRTELIREACAQIRSSHVDPDRESVEEVRAARRHLLGQLPDLERVLADPASGAPALGSTIRDHLAAIEDELRHSSGAPEDRARLRATADRLAQAATAVEARR